MAAPLFYKAVVGFYQEKILSRFNFKNTKQVKELEVKSFVFTCKSPSGMTRQERYEHIKALMNR